MNLSKKHRIMLRICGILFVICIMAAVPYCVAIRQEKQSKANEADAIALRSVIAEAYITTSRDAEFENTATEDQPMEIPEKYYTYVESVQGDGRVYVFIDVEGNVNAYFGTPEKTIRYYAAVAG